MTSNTDKLNVSIAIPILNFPRCLLANMLAKHPLYEVSAMLTSRLTS